jgi:RNA polymerase sigma-70 factor (ECF subfamily)
LLPAARAGDLDAVSTIVSLLYPVVQRYTRSRISSLRDAYDAQNDLLQDWSLRVLKALPSCRATEDQQLIDWALAVARHTVSQFYRREWPQVAGRVEIDELLASEFLEHDSASEIDVSTPLRLALRKAYGELSASAAEVCWLRVIYDASWEEVGDSLGINASAAKRRYQRALVRLRTAIESSDNAEHAQKG